MELIKQFGIDPVMLSAQIVNFLVILYLLKKFLYKPVLSLLKKRQEAINEGLKKSEEAEIRLTRVLEQEKAILQKAQAQAKKIIEQGKEESFSMSRQMEADMKVRSEKILKNALEQIQKETREAEKELTLKISEVAIRILEKSLPSLFSEKDQKAIMQKAIHAIEKS